MDGRYKQRHSNGELLRLLPSISCWACQRSLTVFARECAHEEDDDEDFELQFSVLSAAVQSPHAVLALESSGIGTRARVRD